jgi:phosphoribosylglycinamide formyltransferase-1
MKKIVFLVSGGGANLKFIHKAIRILDVNAYIVGVIADRESLIGDFCKRENIYFSKVKYNKDYNTELLFELTELNPDLIITNIHKVIDSEVLLKFENKFINLHYSLLPAFSGLIGMKTVEEAKKKNVQFIGGTCHEVNEELDSGKILFQSCFSVNNWDEIISNSLVVDTVFKSSCLILFAGILIKLNFEQGRLDQCVINGFNVSFSPALNFKSHDFADNIFKELI